MNPEEVIEQLNLLLALDPCTFRTLLEARTPCNHDLKKAAEGFTYKANETTYIRPLGLLNTALRSSGVTIGVKYDANDNPTSFELITTPRKD